MGRAVGGAYRVRPARAGADGRRRNRGASSSDLRTSRRASSRLARLARAASPGGNAPRPGRCRRAWPGPGRRSIASSRSPSCSAARPSWRCGAGTSGLTARSRRAFFGHAAPVAGRLVQLHQPQVGRAGARRRASPAPRGPCVRRPGRTVAGRRRPAACRRSPARRIPG